jgi:phasin family protein
MFPIHDQISVLTRTNIESQLALFSALSNKALESVEKLMSLNIIAIKSTLEESTQAVQQICAATGPQEAFAVTAAHAQPSMEKVLAYGRGLSSIASGTQAEFVQAAESQISAVNSRVTKLVDDAAKNAPPGSINVVEIMQDAMNNAAKGLDQMSRTSKQAGQAMEANLHAVMDQIVVPRK